MIAPAGSASLRGATRACRRVAGARATAPGGPSARAAICQCRHSAHREEAGRRTEEVKLKRTAIRIPDWLEGAWAAQELLSSPQEISPLMKRLLAPVPRRLILNRIELGLMGKCAR